jgi:hypothetical protein
MGSKRASLKEVVEKIKEYRRNLPKDATLEVQLKFFVWDPFKEEVPDEYRDKSKYKTAEEVDKNFDWEKWKKDISAVFKPEEQRVHIPQNWHTFDPHRGWTPGIDLSKVFVTPDPANTPKNELVKDIEETFKRCLETIKKKNSDYGETDKDPYRNFRNSESVGVDPARAILVRISDKLSRVSTLLSKEQKVSDESVNDTIEDAISYFAILKSYLKNN